MSGTGLFSQCSSLVLTSFFVGSDIWSKQPSNAAFHFIQTWFPICSTAKKEHLRTCLIRWSRQHCYLAFINKGILAKKLFLSVGIRNLRYPQRLSRKLMAKNFSYPVEKVPEYVRTNSQVAAGRTCDLFSISLLGFKARKKGCLHLNQMPTNTGLFK